MKSSYKFGAILLPLALLFAGHAVAMPTLQFVPGSQTVNLGAQASVDINVTNLNNQYVGAFDFDVTWDDSLLSLATVDFGSLLGGPLQSFTSDPLSDPFNPTFGLTGVANLAELSIVIDLTAVQSGNDDFTLFTLTFDTLATGTSPLGFAPGFFGDFLSDETGFIPLLTDASDTGAIIIEQRSVVSAPNTLILLAMGLFVTGWARNR